MLSISNEVINELGINLDSGAGNSGDVAGEEAEDLDGGTGPDIGITNGPSCMPCFVYYYLPFYSLYQHGNHSASESPTGVPSP